MAFSLIDDTLGAVPITALTKDRLSTWLETAPERERNWARSTGFTAETGKLALVPGENGRLGRVLVGLGAGPDAAATMWALAGLADALAGRELPARSRARGRRPDAPGARLGARHLRLHPLPRQARERCGAGLARRAPIAAGSNGSRVRRFSPATSPTRRPAISAPRNWRRRRCASPRRAGACHRVIVGDELLAENYPTIHAVGRASTRPPRLVDIVWGDAGGAQGDPGRQGRVLRHRRARPQTRFRHAADEKGHGRVRRSCSGSPRRSWTRGCRCGCGCCCPASRIRCRAMRCGRSTSSARARG